MKTNNSSDCSRGRESALTSIQWRKRWSRLTSAATAKSLLIVASLIMPVTISLAGSVPPQLLTQRDSSVALPAGGNGDSCGAVVSANGRFVVFSSAANNLVPENDQQFFMNVYLRDRASNTTALVSVALNGTSGGNGHSLYAQVSTNGQFVLFESQTGNLVASNSGWIGDILVRDLQAGTTIAASVATNGSQANGRSYDAVMTPDGHYVAFASFASNLVIGDNNGISDVFVRNMIAGTTTLVSAGATGSVGGTLATPQITPDGNYVAFYSSATGMVAGASANGEVYVRDLGGGMTTWASIDAAPIMQSAFGETVSNVASYYPRLSDDGELVAFKSTGTNVIGLSAIFVYDQVLDLTILVTTNAIGTLPDDENRYGPEMTASGRFIAYASQEPPGGGTNSSVYVWDSLADTNILVSTDGTGVPTNTISDTPVLSHNGRYVVFRSNATTLVTNAVSAGFHFYLRDLQAGTTKLVDADTNGVGSTDVGGAFPSVSADGRIVAFNEPDGQLVGGDFNNALDVFARDTIAGTSELISQRNGTLIPQTGDAMARMWPYAISGNGRWAVFESFADDLVPNDTNGHCDVFLRDLWTGQTSLVSAGMGGTPALGGNSDSAVISANGRYVAFASGATNLTADSVTNINIFRRDLKTGATILISANPVGTGGVMTNYSDPVISADGRYITYLTTRPAFATYWRDVTSNAAVSLGSMVAPVTSLFLPSMSADGRYVAYLTNSSYFPLRIRDTQLGIDIYSNVMVFPSTILYAAISPDGGRVLYLTSANSVLVDQVATGSNLFSFNSSTPVQSSSQWSGDSRYIVLVGTTNSVNAVYLCDLAISNTTLISRNAINGGPPNAASDMPSISGDGRFITYRSYATNIVSGDANPVPKVYLFDRLAGTNAILCAAQTGSNPFPWISAPVISAGAENVAFLSAGPDLVANDFNRVADAFGVRVLMRLQISPVVMPGKTTTVAWQTVPARNYQVQYKDNLTDALWQNLPATISFVGNEAYITVPADHPNRFYQVVETQ
jgi:Tol biopolymer transport system component